MKTLIVSYSFTGNNQQLAEYLRQRLECQSVNIETVRKRNGLSVFLDIFFNRKPALKPLAVKLADYDNIIFTAPIWAGKIAMPLRSLLEREGISIKRYSYITVCGGGNDAQKEKIKSQLIAATGRVPEVVTEIWVKKVMDHRKDTGAIAASVKIETEDLKLFHKELDSFIDSISKIEEPVRLS